MILPGYNKPGGAAAWWCIILCGVPVFLTIADIFFFGGDLLGLYVGAAAEILALASLAIAPVLAGTSIFQVLRTGTRLTFLHFIPLLIVLSLFGFFVLAAVELMSP